MNIHFYYEVFFVFIIVYGWERSKAAPPNSIEETLNNNQNFKLLHDFTNNETTSDENKDAIYVTHFPNNYTSMTNTSTKKKFFRHSPIIIAYVSTNEERTRNIDLSTILQQIIGQMFQGPNIEDSNGNTKYSNFESLPKKHHKKKAIRRSSDNFLETVKSRVIKSSHNIANNSKNLVNRIGTEVNSIIFSAGNALVNKVHRRETDLDNADSELHCKHHNHEHDHEHHELGACELCNNIFNMLNKEQLVENATQHTATPLDAKNHTENRINTFIQNKKDIHINHNDTHAPFIFPDDIWDFPFRNFNENIDEENSTTDSEFLSFPSVSADKLMAVTVDKVKTQAHNGVSSIENKQPHTEKSTETNDLQIVNISGTRLGANSKRATVIKKTTLPLVNTQKDSTLTTTNTKDTDIKSTHFSSDSTESGKEQSGNLIKTNEITSTKNTENSSANNETNSIMNKDTVQIVENNVSLSPNSKHVYPKIPTDMVKLSNDDVTVEGLVTLKKVSSEYVPVRTQKRIRRHAQQNNLLPKFFGGEDGDDSLLFPSSRENEFYLKNLENANSGFKNEEGNTLPKNKIVKPNILTEEIIDLQNFESLFDKENGKMQPPKHIPQDLNLQREYTGSTANSPPPYFFTVTLPTFLCFSLVMVGLCYLLRSGSWCCDLFKPPENATNKNAPNSTENEHI